MMNTNIKPTANGLDSEIQAKINSKTKPVGSLGKLESIALKIARIQQTLNPVLKLPTIVVFAGDHGIAKTGLVNPYPQEVTFQMLLNFINEGAAINVFAEQNGISLKIVDAGVNYDFESLDGLIDAKIAMGTANYLYGPAMSMQQCEQALNKGAEIVEALHLQGCNVVGFGEMGIGNTSSASLLMSMICQIPISQCVGNGTGVNKEQFRLKLSTLEKTIEFHYAINQNDTFEILQTFGGFEIAQMCGGMLKAAELGMLVLVDGFISSAAFLVAREINKNVMDYALLTHRSDEQGHGKMLQFMEVSSIMNIGMRLGEGSGIAVSYPIIEAAVNFFNDMASFESAQVSSK